MADRSPEKLATQGAGGQDAPGEPSNRADAGEAAKAPANSEAKPNTQAKPDAAAATPAPETARGARRRKRKTDRRRRIEALVEAAKSPPPEPASGADGEPHPEAAAPAEAVETVLAEPPTAETGTAPTEGASGLEAAAAEPAVEAAEPSAAVDEAPPAAQAAAEQEAPPADRAELEQAAAVDPAAAQPSEVEADAAAQASGVGAAEEQVSDEASQYPGEAAAHADGLAEVMPFDEDAETAEEMDAEELDIADAVEVTAVEERPKPLLPSPLPEAPPNWHENVFDDDYMRVLAPPDAAQFERELRFFVDSLAVKPGSRILDVGCGLGAHAIELQARGFDMVGLDSSMPLLMRATEEAQRRGLGPSFVHGDMRALSLEGEFDGVLCVHGTFGYFDELANYEVVATLYRSLRSGGRILLGVPNRDYFVGDLPARICWQAEGCMVLDEVDFDFLRGRLEVKRSIAIEDGRQVEHRYSIRTYALHELAALVEEAGFGVVSVSGHIATRDTFLGPHSGSILLVGQKP